MRYALFVVLSNIIAISVHAQNLPPILKGDRPKKGIYTSFDEFLNDSPSIQTEFVLKPRSKSKQFWAGGSDYALLIPDGAGGMKNASKFWGACDGDSVYINVSNYQQNKGYIKLLGLGRFCFTKGLSSPTTEGQTAGYAFGAVGGVLASIPHEAAFIFNINNGQFIQLTSDVLSKILERDDELRKAYALENKKNQRDPDVLLEYIKKFNQGHQDEVGRERLAKIVIYRRAKKERADTVIFVSRENLQYPLGINEVVQFEAPKPKVTLCWSNNCASFPVDDNGINYFQCLNREGEVSQVVPRDAKEGEFHTRQIRYLMAHPDK